MVIHDVFPNPKDGGRPPFEFYSTNNSGIQSPSNVASASYAVAVGDDNTAQGPASIAMGNSDG